MTSDNDSDAMGDHSLTRVIPSPEGKHVVSNYLQVKPLPRLVHAANLKPGVSSRVKPTRIQYVNDNKMLTVAVACHTCTLGVHLARLKRGTNDNSQT